MSTPLRVLIVEDTLDDAELMILILTGDGFDLDCRRVDDEPSYLAALETEPDLILADWSLPHFSGLRALQLMRQRGLDIPFIIVSGSVGEESAVDAMRQGAYDYMLKDRPARLGQAVRHALEDKRMREEHRKADAALQESEEKYRILVENAGEAIYVTQDGMIKFANPRAEEFGGYTREELTSRPFIHFVHPDDQARVLERHMARLRGAELSPRDTFRIVQSSGETRWVEIGAAAIAWEGRPATLNFVTDITERKRAEEERENLQGQLVQAQKMEAVGRLAGGVAHDFNNMLQAILGNTDIALLEAGADSGLRGTLQEIRKAALRSADLTRQLLAFARKQMVNPKVLDLNDSVSGMLKMLQRLIGEDIDLAWKPGHDLWTVKIDPSQIDQILANLAVNARDAIAGVGKLTIGTANVVLDEAYHASHTQAAPGEYVLLAVSDNGVGMGKEILDHLFEPFFTTKDVGKGTGLGLATVHGIVQQNGGFIHVYTEPGQGTTFKIYLPRFEAAPGDVASAPAVAPPRGGSETVLLVEDEEVVLTLGRRILEHLGYAVLTASSPAQAIDLAGEHAGAIHLLVTDVVMPGMNGRELAQRLAPQQPDMHCLFMSGYTADVIAHRSVLESGVHFIQKPFSAAELADSVRQALANTGLT